MSASNRTSDAKRIAVLAAVRSGVSNRQVARDLGIDESSVRRIRSSDRIGETPIEYLNKKQGGFNWRDSIPVVQSMQKLRSDASWSQQVADLKVDASGPIGIMCLGDTHIGAVGSDYTKLIELTDMIVNTPNLYVALLGDLVEMAIRLRSVAEVCAQVLDPYMQTEFIDSWLDEIKHKVLWATHGNHETDRNEQMAGQCPIRNVLAKHVPYFSGIGHVDLEVGGQHYKIATSHVFKGMTQFDPGAGCKRYMRTEWPEANACIQGDCHRPSISVYNEGANNRVAITCGTLNVKSGYAARYFSMFTSSAFPVLALWPGEHRMVPFFNVDQFMATLST